MSGAGTPLDLRQVLLLDTEARMQQAVGEIPVVREQQEPLRVPIEPSDGEDPRAIVRQEGLEILATLGIPHRCHDPGRLVERVVPDAGVEVHREAVDPDLVPLGVRLVAERRHHSVDRHPTLDHEALTGPAGAVPGASQRTLEPLLRHDQLGSGRSSRSGSPDPESTTSRSAGPSSSASSPRSGAMAGSEAREGSPRRSRKAGVVANRAGRPGDSSRPASSTRPRSTRARSTPSEFTPRMPEIWCRVTGCLYATMASVSSDALVNRA